MLRGLSSLKLNPLQHSPVQYNIIQLLNTVMEYILYKTVTVYPVDPALSVLLQFSDSSSQDTSNIKHQTKGTSISATADLLIYLQQYLLLQFSSQTGFWIQQKVHTPAVLNQWQSNDNLLQYWWIQQAALRTIHQIRVSSTSSRKKEKLSFIW